MQRILLKNLQPPDCQSGRIRYRCNKIDSCKSANLGYLVFFIEFAAVGMGILMAGAVVCHLKTKGIISRATPASLMLLMCALVFYLVKQLDSVSFRTADSKLRESVDLAEVCLADLQVDERIIQHLRSEWGIEELFPPQREALPYALAGHVMLTIPTASGKSLVAHLTMIQRLISDLNGARGLYIVPLLASEKVEELQELAV